MWHEIFAVFPAIGKNKFPQIKNTANIFPAKIYSRVNILQLKLFATQKIKYCQIVSVQSQFVSFIQKQRNTGLLFENMFLLHVLNKNENIINAGYWVLSENRKN